MAKQDRIEFRSTPLEFDNRIESAGDQVLSATENLTNTVAAIAKDKNVEIGIEEGRQQVADQGLDWRPDAKQSDLFGLSWQSSRDKARETAAKDAFTARARIDIRDNNTRLAKEHENDPEAYSTAMDEYTNTIFEGLPEDFLNQIGLIADDYKGQTYTQLLNRQADIQEQVDLQDIIAGNIALSEDAVSLAAQGNYTSTTVAFDTASDNWDNMVLNGTMSASQAESNKNNLSEKIDFQYHSGRIDRLVANEDYEGVFDYMNALIGNQEFSVVSPLGLESDEQAYGQKSDEVNNISEANRERLIALTNKITTDYSARQTAIDKSDKDDGKEQLAGWLKVANEGGVIDPIQLQEWVENIRAIGDEVLTNDAEQFQQVYTYLNQDVVGDEQTYTAMANRSLRGMEVYIAGLKDADDTKGNKLLIEMAEAIYETAKNSDITYGVTRGWYDIDPLIFDGTLDEQLKERKINQAEYSLRMGAETNVSLFTDEEERLIIENVETNPSMLLEFVEGLGGEATGVLEKLGVKNPIIGIAGNLFLDGKIALGNSLFRRSRDHKSTK